MGGRYVVSDDNKMIFCTDAKNLYGWVFVENLLYQNERCGEFILIVISIIEKTYWILPMKVTLIISMKVI